MYLLKNRIKELKWFLALIFYPICGGIGFSSCESFGRRASKTKMPFSFRRSKEMKIDLIKKRQVFVCDRKSHCIGF